MKKIKDTPRIIGVLLLLTLNTSFIQAQTASPKEPMVDARVASNLKQSPELRDGQHDFDFHVGMWKSSIKRLLHPLTGSTTWVEMKGTLVARKVWDGRAQIEELEADGPSGHIEDLLLFLYNPQSHQW
jgi:hypothetical protein